jgi:UDP-glucose 4-epimerase
MIDIKGSRILITGGAGFVGSTILNQLLQAGVKEIIIIDNFIRGSKENIKGVISSDRVKLVEGDIRDQDLINELLRGIDYCFHLAALRITRCVEYPREAFEVMYAGTFNILQSCVEHKIKKLVLASSASVYGQADTFPTTEEQHPYNNRTLYGAAKMANELMCRSFQHMYDLNHNSVRYFNVYGPRMDSTGKYTEVLIRWYRLIRQGKRPLIYGSGKQAMDFVYIDDIARATILALTADVKNEVFNVASGVETSIEQLCFLLLEAMGSDLKPEYIPVPDERQQVEVMRRLGDTSKAKRVIGFETKVGLKEGLKRLVKWLDTQEKLILQNA